MPTTITVPDSNDSEVLVRVENVSKKFCRSLKKSLWYGVRDVAHALNPFAGSNEADHQATNTKPEAPALRADEFWAVKNISFELKRGECLGLIGHNGAGKSTLLKILNSLIAPDTGRIIMKGRVCALVELNAGFNPILTGRENIFNQAALLGFTRSETLTKMDAIIEFAEIGDFLDMPVKNYSSGMKVRLGFAVAAQMEPDVLIIDEVLAVGDAQFRHKCLSRMHELSGQTAVIFVSHSMPQIFRIVSRIMHLSSGSIAYYGSNVGDGITGYLANVETKGPDRIGLDGIELSDILLFCNNSSAPLSNEPIVKHGDSLRFQMKVRIPAGLGIVAMKMSLWNLEMIPSCDIVDVNLSNYIVESEKVELVTVNIDLPSLQLSTGRYSLTVVFTDDKFSKIHARYENMMQIVVKSIYPTGAIFTLPAKWITIPRY